MEPDMRMNIPRPARQADPSKYLDEGLSQAFRVVLDEGVPDRFAVLLDALGRKGSDHDPVPTDPTDPDTDPFPPR